MCCCSCGYIVAEPNEILVKTGAGVKDIEITKKTFCFPYQKVRVVDLNPITFTHEFPAMSKDTAAFQIPITFTVGPTDAVKDVQGFLQYIRRISNLHTKQVEQIVAAVAHSHVRELCQQREMTDLHEGRLGFKDHLIERTARGLEDFGLHVFNVNIGEIKNVRRETINVENVVIE